MTKIFATTLTFLLFSIFTVSAQHKKIDTLRVALSRAVTDSNKYRALRDLGNIYYISNPDSSIIFDQQAFLIAKKNNWKKFQASSWNGIASAYATMGDYATGIQYYLRSLKIYEALDFEMGMSSVNGNIGATYVQKQDYNRALPYLQLCLKQYYHYGSVHKFTPREARSEPINLSNLGECYLYLKNIDSAKYYLDSSLVSSHKIHYSDVDGSIKRDLGEVEVLKGNKTAALRYFREAIANDQAIDDVENLSIVYLSMAKFYHQDKKQDSAEYYAQKALDTAAAGKYLQDVLNAGNELYSYYDEDHNLPAAYKYFKITTAAKDSLYSQDKVKQLLTLDFNEKQRLQELEAARAEEQNKVRIYILSGGVAILLLLALVFWRIGKQRQKANNLLSRQKKEIENQRDQTDKALTELQQTQAQLVQREKMASLGELTAGIAHEIQNPLNFVNNFSDVNMELLEEMQVEITKGDMDEVKAIASDISENEKKINLHGKRADSIVKGMLEHSRSSSSQKEFTDINQLSDEYLRLSYHGLRAKDKSFDAELVTHFDPSLPKVNAIPQEIGRVMLNLFNNAFYAVNQNRKTAGPDYKPTVEVSTLSENRHVIIKVKDNGVGIPEHIKEKIMQPFFTTKPAGEGTGLGLSLTYDMVIKGHGGKIQINSLEGKGAEFTIHLPIN
ncbi:MAG TPA: ATP-binding protein [Mucilaginibacter sp.]|nr:ATP-binding protein [Mucilaginibacter sp.]